MCEFTSNTQMLFDDNKFIDNRSLSQFIAQHDQQSDLTHKLYRFKNAFHQLPESSNPLVRGLKKNLVNEALFNLSPHFDPANSRIVVEHNLAFANNGSETSEGSKKFIHFIEIHF